MTGELTGDQARAIAASVGQQLQFEWMTTYKVLKAIPDAKRDYRPETNSRSAWELATHMAAADVWFLDSILAGEFGQPAPPQAASSEALAEWYKQAFPDRLEKVLALDGAKLTQIINFYGMKMPAVQYMVFALTHMVHHRGQLSTYLRPMGGKVPAIYGGSFDEQWTGAQDANA